jgi:hypothetical protein
MYLGVEKLTIICINMNYLTQFLYANHEILLSL